MRQCRECLLEKSDEDFGKTPAGNYRRKCKACDYQTVLKRKASDPERWATQKRYIILKHKYGITREEYDLLLVKQNGVCKICKQPESGGRWLSVDHCHDSLEIRGLLCHTCNTGIGMFNDNIETLQSAIDYLKGSDSD